MHTFSPVSLGSVESSKINFVELLIPNCVELSIVTPVKLLMIKISMIFSRMIFVILLGVIFVKFLETSIVLLRNFDFSVTNSIKSPMDCLVEVSMEDPLDMLVVEDTEQRTHKTPKTTTTVTRINRPSMLLTVVTD